MSPGRSCTSAWFRIWVHCLQQGDMIDFPCTHASRSSYKCNKWYRASNTMLPASGERLLESPVLRPRAPSSFTPVVHTSPSRVSATLCMPPAATCFTWGVQKRRDSCQEESVQCSELGAYKGSIREVLCWSGEPACCSFRRQHKGGLTQDSQHLLNALRWKKCLLIVLC